MQTCSRAAHPLRNGHRSLSRRTPAFFSTSPAAQATDPAKDLAGIFGTTRTRRPNAEPAASRDRSEASDAHNPALQGYPAPDGTLTRSTATPDTTTNEYAPARTNQNNVPSGTSPASRSPSMGNTLAKNVRSTATQSLSPQPSPSRPSRQGSATAELTQSLRNNVRDPASSQRPLDNSSSGTRVAAQRNEVQRHRAALQAAGVQNKEAGQFSRRVESQQPRVWQPGDVYAPHDLSAAEAMKTSRAGSTSLRNLQARRPLTRSTGGTDVFDAMCIDPVKEYKNFAMMGEFVTEMGRIKGRRITGLRLVNQRKLARGVRRAIGLGLVPSVHQHPELFESRMEQMGRKVPRNYLKGV